MHRPARFPVLALASCALLLVTLSACVPAASTAGPRPARPTTTAPHGAVRTGGSVWSIPAAQIATSARSADWAARFWANADLHDHDLGVEFGLDEPSNDYSVPVYSTADATTTARVFRRPVDAWNGRFDVDPGDRIPWNPGWLPADGRDGHLVVLDSSSGEEWDLWAVSTPTFQAPYLTQVECATDLTNLAAGYSPAGDLCAASVMHITDPAGRGVDVRTYLGNYPGATGSGIQFSAGLTTPAEVASGRIGHAVRVAVSDRLSMTGPACPESVTDPDDPRVGTTCGVAVAPAGKFESKRHLSDESELRGMVPDGTRYVLDLTDAEIESWLDSRGYDGALRRSARTFAVALRDFGMIQTATTGGPATLLVSGGRNPVTAAGWRSVGIDGTGADLLDGLLRPDRIRVLAPAMNHCDGVASRLACWSDRTTAS